MGSVEKLVVVIVRVWDFKGCWDLGGDQKKLRDQGV